VSREGVPAQLLVYKLKTPSQDALIQPSTFSRRHTKTHSDNNRRHPERDCHRSTTTQLWNADMPTSSNHTEVSVHCCHDKHTVASSRTLLSDLVHHNGTTDSGDGARPLPPPKIRPGYEKVRVRPRSTRSTLCTLHSATLQPMKEMQAKHRCLPVRHNLDRSPKISTPRRRGSAEGTDHNAANPISVVHHACRLLLAGPLLRILIDTEDGGGTFPETSMSLHRITWYWKEEGRNLHEKGLHASAPVYVSCERYIMGQSTRQ
jgi:hypothetical protein